MTAASRGGALELPRRLRAELERRARAAAPEEACGLLLGRVEGEVARVERLAPARNLAGPLARERYVLDPADHLRAHRLADELGLAVLGAWHSHPRAGAAPSERDRREALEDWWHVIVGLAPRELRAWRVGHGLQGERALSPAPPASAPAPAPT